MIGVIIFLAELAIMHMVGSWFPTLNPWLETLWDASLITMVVSGASYWLIFHPLIENLRDGNAMRRVRLIISLSTVFAEFGLIIFTTEGFIMLLMGWLINTATLWHNFIDAFLLALVMVPCIELWIIPRFMNVQGERLTRSLPIFSALLIPALMVFFSLFMAFFDGVSMQILVLWGVLLVILILGLGVLARLVVHWNQAETALEQYAAQLEAKVEERTRLLVQSERLATLGTFSASMAHEINNPNAFVAGNAHFLKLYWEKVEPILHQHGHEDDTGRVSLFLPEIVDTLNGIIQGTQRITKILDSLKSYARQDGSDSERVVCRLMEPLRDAATLLVHELNKGITLELLVSDEIMITCDRQQICQVFVNLFRNAMESMAGGQPGGEKWIRVTTSTADGELIISVQDNGPGIPMTVINKIFDPFYTTKGKTKGTGLGLSICQGIIEKHKGRILAESPTGEGARFLVFLPKSKASV